MDTEISRSIFSKARDRYDSAMRIAFLAILGLIVFHLTTFQPFIDATARLSRVKIKNESLGVVLTFLRIRAFAGCCSQFIS